MYKWTNERDILRDLCEVQGDVPIDVHGTIGAEDKPPPLNIKEETEEEYFACSGDAPDGAAPDLKLIQQMLNIVRNNSIGSDSDENETPLPITPAKIEITKPSPNVQTTKPSPNDQITKPSPNDQTTKPSPNDQTTKPAPSIPTTKRTKKKKQNNVAINSILSNQKEDPTKLISPDDLVTDLETNSKTEAKDTINEASTNKDKVVKAKKPVVLLEAPTNMFRKKCKVKSPASAVSSNSSTSVSPSSSKISPSCSKVFTPSPSVTGYLKELQEKAKLKESIVEDVWTKAMKQMKAIEEKRKKELELAASTNHNRNRDDGETSSEEEEEEEYDRSEPYDPMKMLKLPRHRHFLTKSCVICSVFQQRGISIYSGEDNNK